MGIVYYQATLDKIKNLRNGRFIFFGSRFRNIGIHFPAKPVKFGIQVAFGNHQLAGRLVNHDVISGLVFRLGYEAIGLGKAPLPEIGIALMRGHDNQSMTVACIKNDGESAFGSKNSAWPGILVMGSGFTENFESTLVLHGSNLRTNHTNIVGGILHHTIHEYPGTTRYLDHHPGVAYQFLTIKNVLFNDMCIAVHGDDNAQIHHAIKLLQVTPERDIR